MEEPRFVSGATRSGAEWRRVPVPALFVRMEIDRDLTVRKEPSFVYPVLTDFFPVGQPLPFVAEFLDAERRSLSCASLREDCWHCASDCWPKRIRQTLSFPPGARYFRVLLERETIYEEDIPDPPELEIRCSYDRESDRIHVGWAAYLPRDEGERARRRRESNARLWYLLHYCSRGAWRGVGPRTEANEAYLDVKRMGLSGTVRIRVIATSGIATAIAECAGEPDARDTGPELQMVAVAPDPAENPVPLGGHWRVNVVDGGGRSAPDTRIRWYDEGGRELASGRDLDLRPLGAGEHVIHAVATGSGSRPLFRTFLIGRPEPHGPCYLAASTPVQRRPDSAAHQHEEGEMHDY